jgi:hypothetical protein
MKLERGKGIGFVVTVNDKEYDATNIYFYKDNKVFLHSECNELLDKKYSYSADELELPIKEIKLRRKVKFDDEVFIISKGSSYGRLYCDLYIPSDMLDIHFVERVLSEDKEWTFTIYESSSNFYIRKYEHYIKRYVREKLNDIVNQFRETSNYISRYNLEKCPEDILEKLDELNIITKKYIKEKIKIDNLTIDDIDMADLEAYYKE